MNESQRKAVEYCDGPALVIAGAGSGKTRVLTYKIAYLLSKGMRPWNILALTFTNKAANEMKLRIGTIVGDNMARKLNMGTFHSVFSRILRAEAANINYTPNFTIYDESDSRSLIKTIIKEMQLDDKTYKPGEVLSRISTAKNYLVTASDYMNNHEAIRKDTQMRKGRICDVYKLYAEKCKAEGVMDFDDILLYTNILLNKHPEVAESLRSVISHILVDEYQDTNMAQYRIVRILAARNHNITVVGDDSQSIYAFRGARIQNILNFKRDYPEAREFRLEQNYRSTQTIVNAANSVIAHNTNRLKKECFSEGDKGEKIELIRAYDDREEAASIVSSIMRRIYSTKASYDSFSILYRVNSQSRVLEEALRKKNIPYIIYAGHSFYERKEVKDMLAYMRLVLNHSDNEAFRRVVNLPARGIGQTSMARLSEAASASGMSLWEMCSSPELGRWDIKEAAAAKLRMFADMIDSFKARIWTDDAYTLAVAIAEGSGLLPSLRADMSVEGMSALGNVTELLNGVQEFVANEVETAEQMGEHGKIPTLEAYMENVALLTDADKAEDEDENNRVKLMTVHASKGLEFPYVYIAGMEENLFPSSMSSTAENVEEERRLFYVALTRAEKAVTLSYAGSRFLNGKTSACRPSRFLKEIDPRYLDGTVEDFSSVGGDDYGDDDSGWNGWRQHRSQPQIHNQVQARQEAVSVRPDMSRFKPVEKARTFSGPIAESVSAGDKVRHDKFGIGEVISVSGSAPDIKAVVRFDAAGEKTLLLKFARLQKI